jgi:glycopeptide antibiotics resistance protein
LNAPLFRSPSTRPVLGRGHYALLALAFLAFAVYGSLMPFQYKLIPFAEALDRFREVLGQPVRVGSRSDWLANVLLFFPPGFLLMAAICCDRPRLNVLAFPLVVTSCIAFSVTIEFAQLYFPERNCSINDIVAESLGALLGAVLWVFRGQRLTTTARLIWTGFGSRNTIVLLLPCYLLLVLVVSTLPLDFTLSPVEIYHKYHEGRVRLTPFDWGKIGTIDLIKRCFWNVALLVPVGLLLGCLPGSIWRSARSWPRVLGLGLLLASGIEFVQLFVGTSSCDVTDIITGGPAVLAGWFLALLYHRRQASRFGYLRVSNTFSPLHWGLLAAWLSVLFFMEWEPFDFTFDLDRAARELRNVTLIPFKDYYRGDYLGILDDFVHKFILFMPLGALLAPPPPARAWSRAGLFRWFGAIGAAFVMELGQSFLFSRHPGLTDVLVASTAAWLGLALTCRLRNAPRAETGIPVRVVTFRR